MTATAGVYMSGIHGRHRCLLIRPHLERGLVRGYSKTSEEKNKEVYVANGFRGPRAWSWQGLLTTSQHDGCHHGGGRGKE